MPSINDEVRWESECARAAHLLNSLDRYDHIVLPLEGYPVVFFQDEEGDKYTPAYVVFQDRLKTLQVSTTFIKPAENISCCGSVS